MKRRQPVEPARRGQPDRAAALAQYRRRAGIYDLELALFEPIRQRAIERLALQTGQTVIDVGCGTGLSLQGLRQGVGARGRVIGIEQSPEMIERARQRVRQARWRNVQLVCAPVEDAAIDAQADAALFNFTHDILRRPEAVSNVVAHLRPDACVVASGLQWMRSWAAAGNLFVLLAARRSVTALEGLHRPWSHLERHLQAIESEPLLFGAVFLVSGRVRQHAAGAAGDAPAAQAPHRPHNRPTRGDPDR